MITNHTKAATVAIMLALGCMNPVSFVRANLVNGAQLLVGDTLNPAAYGFPITAKEVPEKRTERSAVFELSPGKLAAVSSTTPLFTKNATGNWVPIRIEGRVESGRFVFDQLAGSTEITFDLTHPEYTLHHDGHWYSIRFNTPASGMVVTPNTVAYGLAEGVTLRWSVEGQRVRKEILFDDPKASADLSFTVTSDLNAQLEGNHLSFGDVFSFPEPFLTDTNLRKLDVPVQLIRNGNEYNYAYEAPEERYILDPSEGPNIPGTITNAALSGGDGSWTNPGNADESDDSDATISRSFSTTTWDLYARNYGFSIPASATIDGIEVSIERSCSNPGGDYCTDASVSLVFEGVLDGDEKSDNVTTWPSSDGTVTYGGASDTWGLTMTGATVNDSGFGVALSVQFTVAGGPP